MGKSKRSFAEDLSVSYECALAIGNSLNLTEMLHQVIHTIVQKTSAARGIIWIKNSEAELMPIVSAGIRISKVLNKDGMDSARVIFKPIQQKGQFLLRNKGDEEFTKYFVSPTGREQSVLIVPVGNIGMLHLVYDNKGIADESLGNILIGLAPKLSTAIDACVIYENLNIEILARQAIEDALRKKTDEAISTHEDFLELYSESEKGRRTLLSILEDVSEKEEALRESEQKYRSLIDQSQDVIYLLYEGKFELINKRFEELFGYTLEEVNAPDFHFMNLVAPQSRAMVEERAEKVYRGEAVPPQYEFTALHRDGRNIDVETSMSYIKYKEGIAAQGIVRDITERKQARERIERLNTVLRAIRNVNQLITREKDRDRLIKSACETLIETRGYHHAWIVVLDELGGLVTTAQAGCDVEFLSMIEHWRCGDLPGCAQRALEQSDVVVREDAPSAYVDYRLAVEKSGVTTMTVGLRHVDKVYGVLNVSLVADFNVYGEEESMFEEVAGDLALALHSIELEESHNRMDRQMEKRREYLASVLRYIPDAIITEDAGKRIAEWNLGAERLFGYSRDEAQGKDVNDLIARSDVEDQARYFSKRTQSGKDVPPTEVVRYRNDGTPLTLIMAVSPIMSEGRVQGTVAVYTDITERKRMEHEIEERREYLSAVLRHAPDAILTLDTSNFIEEWNPGAEGLFGYAYHEAHGKCIDDLIALPEVEEQARFFSMQASAGKEIPPIEVIRFRKDGTPINLILANSPIMIDNELHGSVAVYTDITESKRAEEALRASEEKYRGLVNNVRLGIFRHSAEVDGKILEANPAMEEILGYSREELLEKKVLELYVYPEERKPYLQELAATTGKVAKELLFRRKDGTEITVSVTKVAVRDDVGRIMFIEGILEDVTERKRAEEALQEAYDTLEIRVQERTTELAGAIQSLQAEIAERIKMQHQIEEQREYLASVLHHAPDAVITLDSSSRIVGWNPGAEKLFGYSQGEAQGRKTIDLIGSSDVEEQIRAFTSQTMSGQGVPPTEVVRYRKDGMPVNAILSSSPIITGNQVRGIVVIFTDLTERKRTEEELRIKEMQLIHAGRLSSLGEMATGVAHEINQPLAIISLAAEGRLRDIHSGRFDMSILPQELEDILKNVRRIDRIITHMRTFARRTGEWEWVDPEDVLSNVFILLGEQFRMHQISVSHQIENGLPSIKVDANQLEQVFVNILTNARQVLDQKEGEVVESGGAFTKRLICSVSSKRQQKQQYVIFEFADNAFGVSDELKERVFDPFFTTKEAGQGTGLGLSIAYSIVTQALGGKIWVEDNEIGGASFKVALPVVKEVRGESGCEEKKGYQRPENL